MPLNKSDDHVNTDLGDIYEVCDEYIKSIDALLKIRKGDSKRIVAALKDIKTNLYIHLDYHCKILKKPFDRLIDKLDK